MLEYGSPLNLLPTGPTMWGALACWPCRALQVTPFCLVLQTGSHLLTTVSIRHPVFCWSMCQCQPCISHCCSLVNTVLCVFCPYPVRLLQCGMPAWMLARAQVCCVRKSMPTAAAACRLVCGSGGFDSRAGGRRFRTGKGRHALQQCRQMGH